MYGGAIRCEVPVTFVDVSDLRQVPDNQEVYADMSSDQSIICEILERSDVVDAAAVDFYFNELAETNDALQSSKLDSNRALSADELPFLLSKPAYSTGATAWLGVGHQGVYKFHEGEHARNQVRVYMAVLRLPAQESDILITMNVPEWISPVSSSATAASSNNDVEQAQPGQAAGGGQARVEVNPGAPDPYGSATANFMRLLQSFEISNWGLFSP